MNDSAGLSNAALINNIRATFATTLKVLEHLEAALVQAGFAEGRDAYRKMVDTIIGQSLWLTAQGCDLCTDEMARLQSRARAIHALLHPYTETMLRLGAMGGSALAAVAEASADATETPAEPVLAILSRNARPMSITALRAELGCPRKELVSRLAELERHGKVKRQANGGRELFSLRGPA